jgi:hypothetical protein
VQVEPVLREELALAPARADQDTEALLDVQLVGDHGDAAGARALREARREAPARAEESRSSLPSMITVGSPTTGIAPHPQASLVRKAVARRSGRSRCRRKRADRRLMILWRQPAPMQVARDRGRLAPHQHGGDAGPLMVPPWLLMSLTRAAAAIAPPS